MRNAKSVKKTVLRVLLYLAVIIICLITLYPYFVTICTALKSRAEIFSTSGTVFPVEAIWSNLIDVWSKAPMASYMLNSILIAGALRHPCSLRIIQNEIQRTDRFPWIRHCFPDVCPGRSSDWYLQGHDVSAPDQQHHWPDLYQCRI